MYTKFIRPIEEQSLVGLAAIASIIHFGIFTTVVGRSFRSLIDPFTVHRKHTKNLYFLKI